MWLESASIDSELRDLALPWDLPLAQWPEHLVNRGEAGRQIFLNTDQGRYQLQEVSRSCAEESFRMLKTLATYGLPVGRPVLLARERAENLPALLVVHWPQAALTVAEVLSAAKDDDTVKSLAEALASLMVHMHLAGCLCGQDVFAATMLLRQDHGFSALWSPTRGAALAEDPSDSQRSRDLGHALDDLAYLTHTLGIQNDLLVDCFEASYLEIWSNVAETRLFVEDGDMHLRARLTEVADLPADQRHLADKMPEGGVSVRLRCSMIERGHHCLMLQMLTGLDANDRGSRHLLRDIFRYHAWLEFSSGRKWPRALAANRWVNEVYAPAMDQLNNVVTF